MTSKRSFFPVAASCSAGSLVDSLETTVLVCWDVSESALSSIGVEVTAVFCSSRAFFKGVSRSSEEGVLGALDCFATALSEELDQEVDR